MTLGERIASHRRALGISQEELGARLGVSRQAVSKWETSAAVPDMENLLALSREFGVSVAELDCPARAALYEVFIKAMELLDIKMTDKETKRL